MTLGVQYPHGGFSKNKNVKSVDKLWDGWYTTLRLKFINAKSVFIFEVPI